MVRVCFTRQWFGELHGVDLSNLRIGDTLELLEKDADILIKAGCAKPVSDVRERTRGRSGTRDREGKKS
jgi:hypothetical protein